jgi:hypothetical protein
MGWADALRDLIAATGGGSGAGQAASIPNPHETFQQAAQQAPPNVVGQGIAEAFRSNQTPSFPEMISTLFAHSNPEQKAGLLTRLLGSAGPAIPASLASLITGISGNATNVTPQQAAQVPPQAVQQLAQHAQNGNPLIVDEIGQFYSQHPQVVTALGGLALSIAIQHMARHG